MFRPPSGLKSPTTAQIFEVPISKPTIMEELESNMSFPVPKGFGLPGGRLWHSAGLQPGCGNIVGDSQVQAGDGFAALLAGVINCLPTQELLVQVGQTEGNLAALARSHHQNVGL